MFIGSFRTGILRMLCSLAFYLVWIPVLLGSTIDQQFSDVTRLHENRGEFNGQFAKNAVRFIDLWSFLNPQAMFIYREMLTDIEKVDPALASHIEGDLTHQLSLYSTTYDPRWIFEVAAYYVNVLPAFESRHPKKREGLSHSFRIYLCGSEPLGIGR